MAETDPKSVQDLTNVVQTLLQQMQDKFQTIRNHHWCRYVWMEEPFCITSSHSATIKEEFV
uniref:Uncharacterized protein n=1 Tax=Haplochromis burtoni TaxID=8153 RepID=A0A3Q2VK23_HAPBU